MCQKVQEDGATHPAAVFQRMLVEMGAMAMYVALTLCLELGFAHAKDFGERISRASTRWM